MYQHATAAQQQVSSCLCFTLGCLRVVSTQQKQGRFDLTEGSSCSSIQQRCASAGQQHTHKLAAASSHRKLVSEQRKIGGNLGEQDQQKPWLPRLAETRQDQQKAGKTTLGRRAAAAELPSLPSRCCTEPHHRNATADRTPEPF